jgi:hypothetical protein
MDEGRVSAEAQIKVRLSSRLMPFASTCQRDWGGYRAVAEYFPFLLNCDGWDLVFRVEGRLSAEVKIKERLSSP